MKTKGKDLRVIKTDRNIRNSFIRLLGRKGFNSITVQDILDEALINRTTFYNHYSSKYELGELIAAQLLELFDKVLDARFESDEGGIDLFTHLDKMSEKLKEESDAILKMWKVCTETIHLYDDMRDHLQGRIIMYLGRDKDAFRISLAMSILMTVLEYMLTHDNASAADIHAEVVSFYKENLK